MSISLIPTGADETKTTPHGYEAEQSLSGANRSGNDTAVEMRLNGTAASIRQLYLPEPAEKTTEISINPPRDESTQKMQEQPTEPHWFDATYGMTATLYQKCMDIYGEGKGDPAAMQDLLLEVEKYLSFELEKVRKPQVEWVSSWDPIAQCRSELTRLYEYASILREALESDSDEAQPLVDKKTRAAQAADRDVEMLREEWEQQGWGKLNLFDNEYTLITWRGLQFNAKKARTDAYNIRYQALVMEEQSRLLKKSRKEDALKMVKSGISRMQWHYEAAQRADSRRVEWEAERTEARTGAKGLLGGLRKMLSSFARNESLYTLHGVQFNVEEANRREFAKRQDEEKAARSGRKTATAA